MSSAAKRWTDTWAHRVLIIVAVILVVVVVAGGAWWLETRSGPAQVVRELLKATKRMDRQKVISLLSNETLEVVGLLHKDMVAVGVAFDGEAPEPEGQALPDLAYALARRVTAGARSVGRAKIQGQTATVRLQSSPFRRIPDRGDIKLIKEGREWKIDLTDVVKREAPFWHGLAGRPEELNELRSALQGAFEEIETVEESGEGPAGGSRGQRRPPRGQGHGRQARGEPR